MTGDPVRGKPAGSARAVPSECTVLFPRACCPSQRTVIGHPGAAITSSSGRPKAAADSWVEGTI